MTPTPLLLVPSASAGPRRLLRTVAVAAAMALSLLLAGCDGGPADADPVAASQVEVDDNTFSPEVITVPVGTEVTWTWVGDSDHNVVADGPSPAFSSEIQSSGTFSATPTEPGRIDYRCTLHGGMTGAIVVTDGDPTEGT